STHTMMTGYAGEPVETAPFKPRHPDIWSVVTKLQGQTTRGIPAYISMPRERYGGAAYLGNGLNPLIIKEDPNNPEYRPPNLTLASALRPRFEERLDLVSQFDGFRRQVDLSLQGEAMDIYQERAAAILTSEKARRAFEIHREDPRVRDRYGRHEVGQ